MEMHTDRLSDILYKHFRGLDLTDAEREILTAWLDRSPANREVFEQVQDEGEMEKYLSVVMDDVHTENAFGDFKLNVKVVHRRTPWFHLAAAAILLFIAGSVVYVLEARKQHPAQVLTKLSSMKNDIIPGVGKPILTLANGEKVILDSAAKGTIALQGNTKVEKSADGTVTYSTAAGNAILQYNKLQVPRGSQIVNLTLADGTRVWLNAGSSLKYPVAFAANGDRNVEMSGEAYFEVAKDASKPFILTKENSTTRIHVLGTSFNVNAYEDESATLVTLLEGRVNVRRTDQQMMLLPGQQARVTDQITLNKNVDEDQVMAWKNGKFRFGEKADIGSIMRQISRWYDVDIEYRGKIEVHFGGTLSRQASAAKVLESLEMTGNVKFIVEGKKIIVMP